MDETYMKKMQGVNAVLAKELPEQISNMLIGKGLTLAQAKAILERAKDLLEYAVIQNESFLSDVFSANTTEIWNPFSIEDTAHTSDMLWIPEMTSCN